MEASLDWKPIAPTAPELGIEPGTHWCKAREVPLRYLLPHLISSLDNFLTNLAQKLFAVDGSKIYVASGCVPCGFQVKMSRAVPLKITHFDFSFCQRNS